ncbi:hypothetical protein BCEP4_410037 [Burkholderia cepacia]|nr:hypothetical protein BCEP4_410037 [Burkholderia cepacia]
MQEFSKLCRGEWLTFRRVLILVRDSHSAERVGSLDLMLSEVERHGRRDLTQYPPDAGGPKTCRKKLLNECAGITAPHVAHW